MNKQIKYNIRKMRSDDNSSVAVLIRDNLEQYGLDIPGTVYFDSMVDNLYEAYSGSNKRGYYVLTDENDRVIGGIGFDRFAHFSDCAELQKLYLDDSVKGFGLGYVLVSFIEDKMKEAGYRASYLETHKNLQAAMHIYEKSGYNLIDRPKEVAHGAMTHFYYKELY